MQYPFDTTCFDFKADPLDVNDKLWVLKVYEDECESMQFTGLKDKNGKEIYESDLLHMKDGTCNPYTVNWSEALGGWGITGHLVGVDSWLKMYIEDLEVIGNVYETPELLTNN